LIKKNSLTLKKYINCLKKYLKIFHLRIFRKNKNIVTLNILHYYASTKKIKKKLIQNNFFQTYKSRNLDNYSVKKIKKLREKNPQFNFFFFDDIEMDRYMEQNWSHRKIYEIYKNSIYGASKADIWRYCILYQYGGVYLDFDASINFSLDEIPEHAEEVISFEKNSVISQISKIYTPHFKFLSSSPTSNAHLEYPKNLVIQWLLIFKKEHLILKNVILEIENNYDFFKGKNFDSVHLAIVNFTAPVVLTKVIWNYLQTGNKIFQKGIDFNGMAKFKDVSSEGVYMQDNYYYKKFNNQPILYENPIRLNVGCGDDLKKLFINTDVIPKSSKVKKMNINQIEKYYPPNSITEIYAKDIIEHMGLPTVRKVIANFSKLLISKGSLTIITPCLDLLIEAKKKNFLSDEELNYLMFAGVYWKKGKSEWDSPNTTQFDWHKNCMTIDLIKKILSENDFEINCINLDNIKTRTKNKGLNMSIKAIRT
jgi:mannosyltransferase OCH1-like enzyme